MKYGGVVAVESRVQVRRDLWNLILKPTNGLRPSTYAAYDSQLQLYYLR